MNIDTIKKTAIMHYSEEDQGWVIQSPLCMEVLACGDSLEEAEDLFDEMLEAHYEDYKAGRLAKRPSAGRPPKGKTKTTIDIDPDIKAGLAAYAKSLGISQGEVIEYLYHFHQKAPGNVRPA